MTKEIFCIAVLLLEVFISFGQITFQKTYGGLSNEFGLSVQQTTDGGYILFGEEDHTGADDWYLVKTDSYGNEIWSRTYGGPDWDFGVSVRQTTDNGYILCGGFSGFGHDSLSLLKTDSAGNEIWSKRYSAASERQVGQSVIETSEGGFLAVGFAEQDTIISVYMVKTDNNGNEEWSKVIPSDGHEFAVGVQETEDGGFAMIGETNTKGHGKRDMLLIKTNNNGDTLWTKAFGTTEDELGKSLYITNDNGFILLGYEYFPGGNLYLVKTDSLGNEEWSKYFGGSGWDMGNSVLQTSDGGYFLAGRKENLTAGTNDFYCLKTDSQGNIIWEYTYPKGILSEVNACQQTNDGGYILLGNTADTTGSLNVDMYLVKINAQGLISIYNNETGFLISDYPNPFSEYFIIDISNVVNENFKLSIFNFLGQVVKSIPTIPQGKTRIEAGDLSSGLYFFELSIENRTIASGKLVKE